MPKEQAYPPFMEVYQGVWNACLSLWPLFLVLLGLGFLQYVPLFFCLLILFGPLLAKFGVQFLQDPHSIDMNQLASDWVERFTDPLWITILLFLLLLYLTWWFLVSAFSDGGIFKTFGRHFQSKEAFSPMSFYKDGIQYLVPMIWLQFYISLYGLAGLIIFGILAGIIVGVMSMFGFGTVVIVIGSLFLGVSLVLLWLLFSLLLAVWTLTAKACLVQGVETKEALRMGWKKCWENNRRIFKGITLIILVYVGVSFIIRVILGIFSLIPLLGILFSMTRILISTAMALLLGLFLAALSVVLAGEKEN
jgi:hypothetical protein